MTDFFDSSDNMKKLKVGRASKYPWDSLEIETSFIAKKGTKLTSIRVQCYNKSKELGKVFRALQHEDGTIEVGRLA